MMKIRYLWAWLLCCTLYAGQCKQMAPEVLHILEDVLDEIYHMSAQEVQEMLQQDLGCINQISAQVLQQKMETNPDLLVINVLSEHWYKDCHITGSINVPLKELIYTVAQWDRNQEIVVYCALDACDAGEKGYILLRCMGFEHIEDYRGGIKEWFQLGYPVEGPCTASYLHEAQIRSFDCKQIDFDFKQSLYHTNYLKRLADKIYTLP